TLTISDDELVSGTMTMAMHSEAIIALASFGDPTASEAPEEDPRALWDSLQEGEDEDLPEGVTKEPYEDGDYIGDTYTFEDLPLDEFVAWMNEDSEDEFSLEHVDGQYVFHATFDMSEMTGEESGGE